MQLKLFKYHPVGLRVLLLSFVFAVSIVSTTHAQQWPFEMWHEGQMVLVEGDTLKGLVKYDLTQDIVQYTHNDQRIEAYSARKILFFEIFDKSVNKYRQFFALPYSKTGAYRTPIFFELLEEGKLTLLARELLEYRTYYTGLYGGSYQRLVLVYKYFLLDEKGNIEDFTVDRRSLSDKMGKHGDDVEKYIRKNKLRLEEKYDLVKIISYYNSFF